MIKGSVSGGGDALQVPGGVVGCYAEDHPGLPAWTATTPGLDQFIRAIRARLPSPAGADP